MERLIDNALLYGSMMQVNQPHLVERYNQALEGLGVPKTERKSFSVDATGFSPEIAGDLKDEQYLDPMGVNRRFIILSPEQAQQPVVNINFSSTVDFMRKFYSHNAEAIKVLTLKDVIYGEIEDSTYSVNDINDILATKRVRFRINTHNRLLEKTQELTNLMKRFRREKDSWKDTDLLNSILSLAKECGDTRYNHIVPKHLQFNASSFWTRHFDGVYVFHDDDDRAVVISEMKLQKRGDGKRKQDRYIYLKNYKRVLDYLERTGRIEPLNLTWLDNSGILELRFDLYVRSQIAARDPEMDLSNLGESDVRRWVHDNLTHVRGQNAFKLPSSLRNAVLNRSDARRLRLSPEMRLMCSRANPEHDDYLLVNRFLSEYVPFDFFTRFIVNKDAFYQDYQNWSDSRKAYAVRLITSMFFPSKHAIWNDFFEDWRLDHA